MILGELQNRMFLQESEKVNISRELVQKVRIWLKQMMISEGGKVNISKDV